MLRRILVSKEIGSTIEINRTSHAFSEACICVLEEGGPVRLHLHLYFLSDTSLQTDGPILFFISGIIQALLKIPEHEDSEAVNSRAFLTFYSIASAW